MKKDISKTYKSKKNGVVTPLSYFEVAVTDVNGRWLRCCTLQGCGAVWFNVPKTHVQRFVLGRRQLAFTAVHVGSIRK